MPDACEAHTYTHTWYTVFYLVILSSAHYVETNHTNSSCAPPHTKHPAHTSHTLRNDINKYINGFNTKPNGRVHDAWQKKSGGWCKIDRKLENRWRTKDGRIAGDHCCYYYCDKGLDSWTCSNNVITHFDCTVFSLPFCWLYNIRTYRKS